MWTAILAAGLVLGLADPAVEVDRPAPKRLIGKRFHAALESRITATWQRVPLREILESVSAEREVAILLDRRVDSGRELPWKFTGLPLQQELAKLAATHGAGLCVVGSTVYIGPPQSVAKVRTLVALRESELLEGDEIKTAGRDIQLLRQATVHWGDLADPRRLVEDLAAGYQLRVDHDEPLPHDLWRGGTVPAATVAESLTLLLIQFDRSFEWIDDARGIRIVPVPDHVAVQRTYRPRRGAVEKIVAEWKVKLPAAEIFAKGRDIEVTGLVEDHDAIAAWLRPAKRPRDGGNTEEPAPLSRQVFTLKLERAPVLALIEEMQKRGVEFVYDEQELADAGVDLDQRINVDVNKAGADEFFHAVFDPVGLSFTIDQHEVTLRPK